MRIVSANCFIRFIQLKTTLRRVSLSKHCSRGSSAKLVLDKLVDYLLSYEYLGFQAKIEEAAKLGLNEAIHKLVYDCVQQYYLCVFWFDPKAVFSHKIYFGIICPALTEALLDPSPFHVN
uniref:LisH domain-containing protein n=1 Tax=Ditylenchus dipsaci TaxID=166011 RepID=A0A915D454_9BILA